MQVVAESSYFLPAYDLRAATAAAAALRQRLADAAAAAQPRRRFGFSRSTKKVPGVGQEPAQRDIAAAAAAAAAEPPTASRSVDTNGAAPSAEQHVTGSSSAQLQPDYGR